MLWSDKTSFLVAVILFGISALYSIFLFRRGFRVDDRINYLLLLLAFGFHTVAMLQRGFRLDRCPIHNLFEATMFVAWTMLLAYLVLGAWSRLRFLGAFASPVLFGIGVFALMPNLDVQGPTASSQAWLSLHVAMFVLAYGAFGLSSVAGLMYLTQEHDLKFRKLRAVSSLMPPIQRLELAASRLLMAGFLLLSAALVVSALGFKHQYGSYFKPDPKIIWSLFVWCLYLALIVMRWRFAQGGRRFAWGAVAGFVFVLLTFWGTSHWSPLHRP